MMTIETLDEKQARSEWGKACSKYGFERCNIEVVRAENAAPIYRITITDEPRR